MLDSRDKRPKLDMREALKQTRVRCVRGTISQSEVTKTKRSLVGSTGGNPLSYALHSGRIEGATHLAARVASDLSIKTAASWLNSIHEVRAGREWAAFVSRAISLPIYYIITEGVLRFICFRFIQRKTIIQNSCANKCRIPYVSAAGGGRFRVREGTGVNVD